MLKILVVDDESAVCNSLKDDLSKEGYAVIIASSGQQALDKLKTEKPDLVLLDARMPEMDGAQALQAIRKIDPDTAVILLAAQEDSEIAQKAMKLGAIQYLPKPLDFAVLKRSIKAQAGRIELKLLEKADILLMDYEEEKVKTILNLFNKEGYRIKKIEEKGPPADLTGEAFDLLVLRQDVLQQDALQVVAGYREMYPLLPVLMLIGPGTKEDLISRVKAYGLCGYLSSRLESYCVISAIYGLVKKYQEKRKIKREKRLTDYILVVDDEPLVCEYVSGFLGKEGYRVTTLTDPQAVLGEVETLKPFMIILDIIMPDIDGLELLKKIKKINPAICVIMMTGVKDDAVCREAIESGAADYIVKPFSMEQLKATILANSIKLNLHKCTRGPG